MADRRLGGEESGRLRVSLETQALRRYSVQFQFPTAHETTQLYTTRLVDLLYCTCTYM